MLLEDFPLEIQVMVMSQIPDIESLCNITRASPVYHAAYREARQDIFQSITVTTLDTVGIGMLDPWTATQTPQLNLDSPNRDRIISDTLHYLGWQFPRDIDTRRLGLDESLAILRLHRKFSDIVYEYCKQQFSLNPLSGESQKSSPATKTELCRIYRALYRYELYSRLFGRGRDIEQHLMATIPTEYDENDIRYMFLSLFPIHEVEEIACIHKFASDLYLEKSAPREMTSLGPICLHSLMKATAVQEVEHVKKEFPIENEVSLREVFESYERAVDTGTWYWKGMDMNASEKRVPNTAWLWASNRGIQNVDFRLRRWGYVFWDEERLKKWNIDAEMMHKFSWRPPVCQWRESFTWLQNGNLA